MSILAWLSRLKRISCWLLISDSQTLIYRSERCFPSSPTDLKNSITSFPFRWAYPSDFSLDYNFFSCSPSTPWNIASFSTSYLFFLIAYRIDYSVYSYCLRIADCLYRFFSKVVANTYTFTLRRQRLWSSVHYLQLGFAQWIARLLHPSSMHTNSEVKLPLQVFLKISGWHSLRNWESAAVSYRVSLVALAFSLVGLACSLLFLLSFCNLFMCSSYFFLWQGISQETVSYLFGLR